MGNWSCKMRHPFGSEFGTCSCVCPADCLRPLSDEEKKKLRRRMLDYVFSDPPKNPHLDSPD